MIDEVKALSEKVKEVISEEVGMECDEISDDTPLLSSGLVDSFTFVTILSVIEEVSGVELDPSELTLDNFDTLSGIHAFVSEYASSAK